MTVRRWVSALVVVGGLVLGGLVLGGCDDPADGRRSDGYGSDGVVDGPLLTSVGTAEDGMLAEVKGRLRHDGACLRLRGMPVVWPEGTTWDATEERLALPGGQAVELGERVSGAGGYLHLRAIRTSFGGDVAAAARACLGPTREIAVFNPGWKVSAG